MRKRDTSLDLIWGASAIAAEIKRTPRQTFYLLQTGKIPARKLGATWVANREVLRRYFSEMWGAA